MKTLYFDCSMGAAGDMLAAALLELLPEPEKIIEKLRALLPMLTFSLDSSVKCGVTGSHFTVRLDGEEEDEHLHDHPHEHGHEHHHDHDHEHHHHHHHSGMNDIERIVSAFAVSDKVKKDVLGVYGLIASAESEVHGEPVGQIHFHEVGTMDAVADVTAVCLLMDEIGAEKVVASPVNVGSGQVKCAHGILPVPAPATALLLKGIPMYSGSIKSELCTPTGAALLRYFVNDFASMPPMRVSAIGYGMGKKDFEAANCVRAMLGESDEQAERVIVLSANIDDMTAESIAYAMERFMEAGALDAYTEAIGMKKSRPGTVINVMCRPGERDKFAGLMFLHTTTLGVRQQELERFTLSRREEVADTEFGPVRVKYASGWGVQRAKPEYADLAAAAGKSGRSLDEVRRAVLKKI